MNYNMLNIKKVFIIIFTVFSNYSFASKNFVVVIPSYNNEKWCTWNISSVLNQDYENFKVIYINDCSTDKTQELVEDYVNNHKNKDKVKIINRENRLGALNNIYDAVQSCPNNSIIVTVDGDDALANKKVLSYLNSVYQDNNIWMTYGQYIEHPSKKLGLNKKFPEDIIKNNAFRKYTWSASHLRTFYAWLFKKIDKNDLLIDGNFFDVAWDAAFLFPMLEMSSNKHFKFINKVLYLYNVTNPINDFRVKALKQHHFANLIRNRKIYKPL